MVKTKNPESLTTKIRQSSLGSALEETGKSFGKSFALTSAFFYIVPTITRKIKNQFPLDMDNYSMPQVTGFATGVGLGAVTNLIQGASYAFLADIHMDSVNDYSNPLNRTYILLAIPFILGNIASGVYEFRRHKKNKDKNKQKTETTQGQSNQQQTRSLESKVNQSNDDYYNNSFNLDDFMKRE